MKIENYKNYEDVFRVFLETTLTFPTIMLTKTEIKELKDSFLEILQLDNPSGNESMVVEWIKDFLDIYNIKPKIDQKQNVFFRIDGEGEPLLLNAHLDSVQPCEEKKPQFDGKKFFSNGRTILGADDLGGVIVILKTIAYLKKHQIKHRPLEILFTSMEEIGGEGIKYFNFSQVFSKQALVIDSIAPLGSLILKAPSKYNFSILIEGKAAHGAQIMNSVSAIQIMSDLIHVLPIGKINSHTFLNIGYIEGGKAINTVPGEAQINGAIKVFTEGEVRGSCDSAQVVIDLILQEIQKTKQTYPKAKVDFKYQQVRSGYVLNRKHAFVKEIKQAMHTVGLIPGIKESFGCSDANTLNAMGYRSVLLGMGITGAHTTKETIELNSLVKLTETLIEMSKKSLEKEKKVL